RRRAAWAAVEPGAPAAPAGAPEIPHASVSGPAGRATTSLTAAASPEPSARRTRTLTAPEHLAPGEIPAPPHDPEARRHPWRRASIMPGGGPQLTSRGSPTRRCAPPADAGAPHRFRCGRHRAGRSWAPRPGPYGG